MTFKIKYLKWLLIGLVAGCGGSDLQVIQDDRLDAPLLLASAQELREFLDGDMLFSTVYTEADGLGPLYIRSSCSSCHKGAARGPGAVQKMALVAVDGFTPLNDQSALRYGHTVRPYLAAGAKTPLSPPPDPDGSLGLKVSTRGGTPVFGRGYLEAVADSEILRVAAKQAAGADGVRGQANRVVYASQPNPDQRFHQHQPGEVNLLGRFGLKARIATLDDFAADASQGDMGMTSPLRPSEPPNPDGLPDDLRPGIDLEVNTINALAAYLRLLEIPTRPKAPAGGAELFKTVGCALCHEPSLHTRADYPIAALADIDAPIYTDLLLHDMGDKLADGLVDQQAGSRQWRTAPLIGLRHLRAYLHDGRALGLRDAVLGHEGPGSEANVSIGRFRSLSDADQQTLLNFVKTL